MLEPNPGCSHPFPVEIDLPPWTVAADVDFRRWLFGFGAGVQILAPAELAEEHHKHAVAVGDLYSIGVSTDTVPPEKQSLRCGPDGLH